MATITQEQLNILLQNKPQGITDEQIIEGLKRRGHTIAEVPTSTTAPITATTTQPAPTPEPQRISFLQRLRQRPLETIAETPVVKGLASVGRFLGMEPFGKGIAVTIGQLSPEKFQFTPEEIPTPTQVLGSAAMTGLTAVAPTTKPLFTSGTKFLPTLAKTVATGASFGAARELAEAEKPEPKRIFEEAGREALTFSVFSSLLGGVSKGLESVGKGFIKMVASQSRRPEKALTYFQKGRFLGSFNAMQKQLKNQLDSFENELQGHLSTQKERIPIRDVIGETIALEQNRIATQVGKAGLRFYDETSALNEFQKALKYVNPKLRISLKHQPDLQELNWIRRQIDAKLGDRSFEKALSELPHVKENLMILRTSIQNIIEKRIPQTADIFQRYSLGLAAKQAFKVAINLEKGVPITLPNIIAGTLIGAPWFFLNKPQYAITTAMGAITLRHPVVQLNIGTLVNYLSQMFGRALTTPEISVINNFLRGMK